jgi:glycyl-tRNA synthetase
MLDKTRRIQQLVKAIGKRLSLSEAEQMIVDRTAELCKADLATSMVVEMTELQGVMGRFYAKLSGEPEDVAEGIFEHYLPRNAEDRLPEGKPGTLVGIADRLDSIAGLFAVGLAPTGSKDPFALRRAALGLVQLLIGKALEFDLDWGLTQAGKLLPVNFSEEDKQAAFEFITGRLRGLMLERGYRYDVVDAVLHRQAAIPAKAQGYIDTLSAWVARSDWMLILPAYSRCVRITRDLDQKFSIQENLFIEPAEKELYAASQKAQRSLTDSKDLNAALEQLEKMVPVINNFFDSVLVMAEDTAIRQNRLGLLQEIVALLNDKVDLSALEGF